MSPPGRKRKHDPTIPAHIDQSKLPTGLYWDRTGNGRWYVLEQVEGRRKAKTVATSRARLSELHAIMEARGGIDRSTLNWLLEQFHDSVQFKTKLAPRTRRDYEKYQKAIRALPTKAGKPLGQLIVSRLNLAFMQRLFDAIAKTHPTKANHLLRYLRRVFNWAMPRGFCTTNPCDGAEQAKETRAVRVPERTTLAALLAFAEQAGSTKAHTKGSVSPYLWNLLELAYLCRLRPIEVITLTDAHVTDEGIHTNRRKGSRDVVVQWTPRLRLAIDTAIARRAQIWTDRKRPTQIRPELRPIIVTESGEQLQRSSLDSAWQRLMRAAVVAGVITAEQKFGMHALKHRGITDTTGTRADKRQASGHKSDSMMDVYDHSVPAVKPTAD